MAVDSTGARCVSVFSLNPSVLTLRSRCMARVGMRMMGRSTLTSSCDSRPPSFRVVVDVRASEISDLRHNARAVDTCNS